MSGDFLAWSASAQKSRALVLHGALNGDDLGIIAMGGEDAYDQMY